MYFFGGPLVGVELYPEREPELEIHGVWKNVSPFVCLFTVWGGKSWAYGG